MDKKVEEIYKIINEKLQDNLQELKDVSKEIMQLISQMKNKNNKKIEEILSKMKIEELKDFCKSQTIENLQSLGKLIQQKTSKMTLVKEKAKDKSPFKINPINLTQPLKFEKDNIYAFFDIIMADIFLIYLISPEEKKVLFFFNGNKAKCLQFEKIENLLEDNSYEKLSIHLLFRKELKDYLVNNVSSNEASFEINNEKLFNDISTEKSELLKDYSFESFYQENEELFPNIKEQLKKFQGNKVEIKIFTNDVKSAQENFQ